jgi:ketosteroid isomerase-like protein
MAGIEANKAVVRRYMQAVVDGDIGTIQALQHPDVKWWILGFGDMDRATFTASVKGGLIAAQERRVEITGLTAEGDRIAVEAWSEMIFPDKVYRNQYHNLLVIRDGLIVEGREYMDTRAAAAAFG